MAGGKRERRSGGEGLPRSIFLIGYRGSGKTSVGRILAERLGWQFIDSDRLAAKRAGRSISEIFGAEGERAFRDLEERVIGDLAERIVAGERMVVAAGGGAVLRPRNVERMRSEGRVVWLRASPEILKTRLSKDERSAQDRPPLLGRSALDEVQDVLRAREPVYRHAAHVEVSAEESDPEVVARSVLEVLHAGR